MRRVATGDFDSMFAAEYAAVLRTVYLICHDTHLAQDITQEAFVELLRHWDKVSRYERPGAWVRRVAIRKLVKAMRRDVRRREAEAEVTFEPPTALEPADLDVLRAVRALPLRQRTAVVLYYYEDRPLDEVAEVLECSPSTAAVHVHRARAKLGGLLQEVSRDGR
jgi:RNA polymerase sigma factor (sigma-70 family)